MAIEDYYKDYTLVATTVAQWGTNTESSATYQGYIQPVSGGETFQDGKAGELVTHRLYTAVSVPAKYGNKITQDSVDYIVIYSDQVGGVTNRQHHKEILLGRFV